jgi:hypothetical protein
MTVISSKILPRPEGQKERDLHNVLDNFITEVRSILNGGLLFSDNFSMKMVTFTSNVSSGAEDEITHNLGKVPTGYIIYSQDNAAFLYNGTTSWTTTKIYLKSSVAETTFKILVF